MHLSAKRVGALLRLAPYSAACHMIAATRVLKHGDTKVAQSHLITSDGAAYAFCGTAAMARVSCQTCTGDHVLQACLSIHAKSHEVARVVKCRSISDRPHWGASANYCAGGTLIGDVLDLQSPPIEGCLVQPGVCDALDQLKATHAALPELLTQVCGAAPILHCSTPLCVHHFLELTCAVLLAPPCQVNKAGAICQQEDKLQSQLLPVAVCCPSTSSAL